MSRPVELLSSFAVALDRAGGDGDSLRRAGDLLALLPVRSADAVTRRLIAFGAISKPRSEKTDPKINSMREALSAISAILESVNKTPRWMAAYIDVLAPESAICWDGAVAMFREESKRRLEKSKKPGATMTDQEISALTKKLAAKLTDESWDLNGGSAAFSMLESSSVSKPLAVAIARELLGITYRTKADAISAIKNWYRHRRGAKASLDEIGSSANTH